MRTAVIVIATGDFIEGARVLFKSLERHGMPDSIERLIVGPEVCEFAKPITLTQDYSWIKLPENGNVESLKNFFPLTLDYDRIISANADMLCVGDASYLWSECIGALPFYAALDTAAQTYFPENIARLCLDPFRIFNAGLYVYCRERLPDLHEQLMREIAAGTVQTYEVGDQGFWNHFFQRSNIEVGLLPSGLNYCLDPHMPQLPVAHQRLIHYTGLKPWRSAPDTGHWIYPYHRTWHDVRNA